MKKQKGPKYSPQELARTKASISRNLKALEDKLKMFRSSSPEKWINEIKGNSLIESNIDLSARSSSGESTSSIRSDESIKTIAENEYFIKQKIGGIGDELRCLSTKVMTEGIQSLQEDLNNIEDGLNGLIQAIDKWDEYSRKPPCQIQKGLIALQNALEELREDTQLLIQNDVHHVKSSEDLQKTFQDSLETVCHIERKIDETNINKHHLNDDFESVQVNLKKMKSILSDLSEQSISLKEYHKGLDNAKEEVKNKIKEIINFPNKCNENVSNQFELFGNLEERDFNHLDSVIGYEITDYILRKEEEEIALLREHYQEALVSSK